MTFIASKQINSITIVLFSQCKSDKIDKPNPTGQNLLGQNLLDGLSFIKIEGFA
jgi:hypothetical protein